MRLATILGLVLAAVVAAGCDIGKLTVNTTSKVLVRAQPGLQQESDYEMARQAIPGALKTVEGFWIVDPDNSRLIKILTEGYCQYATAFVEDDWEVAKFAKDISAIEYHNERATKMFTRCLNYALRSLGARWQKEIFGTQEQVAKLLKDSGSSKRTPMMFAGLALGSMINHNLTRVEMLTYLSTVKAIIERVIELDKKDPPSNLSHRALPYIALGMIHSATGRATGGDPDKAKMYFELALQATGNKFLLARTLMGYRVGLANNDRKFFHDQLKQVLETAPSVWPEQRLANEVAHRKARRYLSKEKELF
jgi:TRAP transporter T-component